MTWKYPICECKALPAQTWSIPVGMLSTRNICHSISQRYGPGRVRFTHRIKNGTTLPRVHNGSDISNVSYIQLFPNKVFTSFLNKFLKEANLFSVKMQTSILTLIFFNCIPCIYYTKVITLSYSISNAISVSLYMYKSVQIINLLLWPYIHEYHIY